MASGARLTFLSCILLQSTFSQLDRWIGFSGIFHIRNTRLGVPIKLGNTWAWFSINWFMMNLREAVRDIGQKGGRGQEKNQIWNVGEKVTFWYGGGGQWPMSFFKLFVSFCWFLILTLLFQYKISRNLEIRNHIYKNWVVSRNSCEELR